MNTASTEEQHHTEATSTAPKPKATRKARPGARQAHVAPGKARSAHKTAPAKKRAKSRRQVGKARPGTKTAKILNLLQRPDGATLQELQQATGWLPHSVRGFLSKLRKKMGLAVTSAKSQDGERRYSVQG